MHGVPDDPSQHPWIWECAERARKLVLGHEVISGPESEWVPYCRYFPEYREKRYGLGDGPTIIADPKSQYLFIQGLGEYTALLITNEGKVSVFVADLLQGLRDKGYLE